MGVGDESVKLSSRYPDGAVCIDYTDWRGNRGLRWVAPWSIWFGVTAYYEKPQWLLKAWCFDSGAVKDFAMCDIHKWGAVND